MTGWIGGVANRLLICYFIPDKFIINYHKDLNLKIAKE